MGKEVLLNLRMDTGDSAERFRVLREEVVKTTEELSRAREANDPKAVEAAQQKLRATRRELDGMSDEMRRAGASAGDLGADLSRVPLFQLSRNAKALRREIGKLDRGTEEYAAKVRELQRVEGELHRARRSLRGSAVDQAFLGRVSNAVSRVGSAISAAVAPVMVAVAAVGTLVSAVTRASRAYADLQEKTQGLRSLTGLQGSDIDWLRGKAQQMAMETTAAGVRITRSAGEIVDAFTLMGSAKPELLGHREALAQATEAALTLAEAAKMETAAAVSALANTMNQFGAGASESNRYINALAAGAKAGSAGVEDISKAIVKFGATASMANLSVEESVGLVEALASKGIRGEVAGTGLNAVLLKLQTGADRFNPKVVGLNQALENLGRANLSTAEKVRLFGEGNIAVGESLIQLRGEVAGLTAAVTGTQEATDQAVTNTDTLQARMAQMRNRFDNLLARLGEALAPLAESLLDFGEQFGQTLSRLLTLLTPVLEFATELTAAIWGGIGAVMKWTSGVMDAGGATERFNRALAQESASLSSLFDVMRRSEAGSRARAEAMAEINRTYGAYLPRLLDERSSLEEVAQAQRIATAALEHNLLARMRAEELEGVERERIRAQREAVKELNRMVSQTDGANAGVMRTRLQEILAMEDAGARMVELQALSQRYGNQGWDGLLRGLGLSKGAFMQQAEAFAEAERAAEAARRGIEEEFALLSEGMREPVRVRVETVHTPKVETARAPQGEAGGASAAPDPKAEERAFTEAQSVLEGWYRKQRTLRLQAHARERGDKRRLESDLASLEMTYLMKKRADLTRFGRSTVELDEQIARREIAIWEAREAERRALEERGAAWRRELRGAEEEEVRDDADAAAEAWAAAHAARVESLESTAKTAQGLSRDLGGLLGQMVVDADATLAEFGRRAAEMALDALHSAVRSSIGSIWAQSLAGADSIATFGAAGIAKATALTLLVEGAFAAAKAAIAPQRFGGKYWVRGADDGLVYQVPFLGTVDGVQWVSQPALISERGGEIVIDHGRSEQIRLRYPWILEQIARVPQRASGTVPPVAAGAGGALGDRGAGAGDLGAQARDRALGDAVRDLQRAVRELRGVLGEPLRATVSYVEMRDKLRSGSARERGGM